MSPQQAHQQQPVQPLQQRQSSNANANANAYNNNAYQPPPSAPGSSSVPRYSQAWPGQQAYPSPVNKHDSGYGENVRPPAHVNHEGHTTNAANVLDPALFPPVKHPQFLHVPDEDRSKAKKKVEVKLGGKHFSHIDPSKERHGQWVISKPDTVLLAIPDAERKKNSVWPRTWRSICMSSEEEHRQAQVWAEDIQVSENDEPEGRDLARYRGKFREGKKVKMFSGVSAGRINHGAEGGIEVEIPRMLSTERDLEVQINELGLRMGWAGQKIFTEREGSHVRKVFLQRTRK